MLSISQILIFNFCCFFTSFLLRSVVYNLLILCSNFFLNIFACLKFNRCNKCLKISSSSPLYTAGIRRWLYHYWPHEFVVSTLHFSVLDFFYLLDKRISVTDPYTTTWSSKIKNDVNTIKIFPNAIRNILPSFLTTLSYLNGLFYCLCFLEVIFYYFFNLLKYIFRYYHLMEKYMYFLLYLNPYLPTERKNFIPVSYISWLHTSTIIFCYVQTALPFYRVGTLLL